MLGKKLQDLRNLKSLRQYEIAEAMGVTQKSICAIEAKDDLHVGTLNRFLKALGGKLKISAEFPKEGISYDLTSSIKED